ncbi:MAG: tyrosine-type recombinase/integrase [Bacteroidales bacterium]|jgi:integrase
MSKKYSKTTADYLSWDQNLNLIRKLYNDGDYKMSLLISIGSFWGLRISDILRLKWQDILERDGFVLIEKKTQKRREIKINSQLRQHIIECYQQIKPMSVDKEIFISQKGSVYSIQRLNVIFKSIKSRYNLKIENYSTHSMRKTFGRQVFTQSGTNAELSLMKLRELFNHSSVIVTRRYLGITRDELLQTYDVLHF